MFENWPQTISRPSFFKPLIIDGDEIGILSERFWRGSPDRGGSEDELDRRHTAKSVVVDSTITLRTGREVGVFGSIPRDP